MFPCCCPSRRGSRRAKAQNEGLFQRVTRWLSSHYGRLWPRGRRQPQGSTLEISNDSHEELIFSGNGQFGGVSTLHLAEVCPLRSLQPCTGAKLEESLVLASPGRTIAYLSTLLCSYDDFSTVPYFLDQIFHSNMASFLGRCRDLYEAELHGRTSLPLLKMKELFQKVVPFHCLGSVWTERNKRGKEHLASTVRATVQQFNCVTNCVVTTCLKDPKMKATDRARVVEHWIKVAKECQTLRNFSSVHAILSALRSTSLYRLKETWGEVSRKCCKKFEHLCEKDNGLSRDRLTKKGAFKLASREKNPQRAQMRLRKQQKGVVPFLGTYLTDLVMLHTAMGDSVHQADISFQKLNKEITVLQEIQLLQVAASKYYFKRDEEFVVWFRSVEFLTENESYALSCQLEPSAKRPAVASRP
nr:ral guanine nucleotide dissociation stimulator isoform X2 [Oryctolagus cuniculus]